MRLLLLSPVLPDAPRDGDRVRIYHWLRELGRRHEVDVVCFGEAAGEPRGGGRPKGAPVHATRVIPMGIWARRFAALRRLFSGLPVTVTSAASARMTAAVDAAIAQAEAEGRPYDAVLCYRLKMAPYALRFKGPRLLDYTDSLTRYAERRAVALRLAGRGWAARWWRWQARQTAAYEAWCAGQFDAGFFNSLQDCRAVQAMAPKAAARLKVAANGVELPKAGLRRRKTGRRRDDEEKRIAFVGQLSYPPNEEAVAWFIERVLPLLRAQEPQAVFLVIGGGAGARLKRLRAVPGARFAGPVADVQAALAGADVSVCPVHSGAGRQNKLLEAFAAGLPAVATRFSAEGAEAAHGRELLVADEPEAFAQAVLQLLRRPALGARLAVAARRLVRRRYRWAGNAAVIERALEQARRRALW